MKAKIVVLWALSWCVFQGVKPDNVLSVDRVASELLPDTTVLYIELPEPGALVDLVLEHPLRDRVEAHPVVAQALESQEMTNFKSGVALFQAGMGMRWKTALQKLTNGGAYLAIDAADEGVALLVRAESRDVIEQLRDTVFGALRAGKVPGSDDDPVKEGEYAGVTGYAIGDDVRAAILDDWLLITNKAEMGKKVIDRFTQEGLPKLADKDSFLNTPAPTQQDDLWAYVDIEMIRESGEAEELYSGRTENILAELLFGGIAANLQHTDHAILTAQASEQQIRATISTPHRAEWAGESRAYFFGEDGAAVGPSMLTPEDVVFALSTYRDSSEMWLRADDLMTTKAVDELVKADTQLTTFFSGRDFGEDILGALEPQIQFVVTRQDFESVTPTPSIKLPAFALQARMKSPGETQPELRRVFQSFIGFINVVGAMNGQPQFDLSWQTVTAPDAENAQVVSATYVPERGEESATDAAINFNFSPAIAFAGRRLILASTTELATQLAKGTVAKTETDSNSAGMLQAATLQAVLEENLDQLIAQNMLEKGHSRAEAAAEVGVLVEILSLFKSAQFALSAGEERLSLQLDIAIAAE